MNEPPATFRLSPQQIVLLARGEAASQVLVELPAGASIESLRPALEALITAHEALRTTFVTPPGASAPIAQTVNDELEAVWSSLDDAGDPLADPHARAELLAREAAQLDLRTGPTVRAAVVQRPSGGPLLALSVCAPAADAASVRLLALELAASAPPAADGEPIQHADYAEWRHELIAGDDADARRGRELWAGTLRDYHAPPLLFSRIRSGGERDMHTLALELEGGPYADDQVLAAWSAVLARVSSTADLLCAELLDGRSQPDLAGAVGPYAQLAPVRVTLEPETTFAELVDRVRRARTDARRWQDLGSEGDLSALAQAAVSAFVAPRPAPDRAFVAPGPSGCALELRIGGAGACELAYDAGVIDERDARILADALSSLLAAAGARSSTPIDQLPLLPASERDAALARGVGAPAADTVELLHHRFERQAAETPNAPALAGSSDRETITFGELNARANRLAHHLIELGAGPELPVGLCIRRSPALITALLGVMKAGAAYLPLNPAHPPARLQGQLAEAGTRILVTEEELAERLSEPTSIANVCIDRDAAAIAARPVTDPPRRAGLDDIAYVMYTSGSTGTPKGVVVTHRNLACYVDAIARRLDAEAGTHFALVSEISTDLGNTAVFPPLATGGCLHVIDAETAMDGAAFGAYAAEHPIDVIKITPTQLRGLLAAGDGFLPRRWLVLGGEALSWELAERVRALGACRVLNHYGPTETTVGCCSFELTDSDHGSGSATVPIGRALAGDRAYVLDGAMGPVPVGVAGQLCIGGEGVARGYLQRPEETALRFVDDPLGGRMYQTGDRARFLPDGSIEFLGRADQQLKIRGYRVEPGEIETVLLAHPAVREAAVVARVDGDGDPRLVAYYVASAPPGGRELHEFLARSLPDYMMPAQWVPVSALPLTASGKVDRLALPDPDQAGPVRTEEFIAPRDDLERDIAAIWGALLGVEEVGVRDDFFALGGHSLLATQAIMRIRRTYGNVPLGALFNSPTVAALADVIRARIAGAQS